MGRTRKTKIVMSGQVYSFADELTPLDEEFFDLVEKCDVPAITEFLATNRVNINMKNFQGITPLHMAIMNDNEPLVDLILSRKGVRIGDSLLFAIEHDNLNLLDRLVKYSAASGGDGRIGGKTNETKNEKDDNDSDSDSEEFPPTMTPLMLAAQCGQYETIKYLLNLGHAVKIPHPPRCGCESDCKEALKRGNVIADGCERLYLYWAISNPTYMCCTSSDDPVLSCFSIYRELLDCGSVDQVYNRVYMDMAEKVKRFAVDLLDKCRTSDEVKILLRNREGCKFRGTFVYPRLITAMDHKQKEFVAHTNVQQVLETAWIGDWIEWKAYSNFWKSAYLLSRFPMLPFTVALGVLAPNSRLNRGNRLPINRMFNSVITYVLFLALLFVQSNANKNIMRRGAPDMVTCVPIAVFVVGHGYEKVKLRLLQGPRRYFANMWNVFDTVKLTLFTVAFTCWAAAAVSVHNGWLDEELDREYWHWADPQLIAEALFAVATVMAYMRLLFLCQLNYNIGLMQVSLGKMLHDFVKFAVFLVIIMVAFTSGLGTLYGYYAGMVNRDPETGQETRQMDSFVTVEDTFKTLFWGIFCMTPLEAPDVVISNCDDNTCHSSGKSSDGSGDSDVDSGVGGSGIGGSGIGGSGIGGPDIQQHRFTQLVGYGLFAVFEVLMVIVMLNMLIAAMSDTFQRVVDNATYEWLFGRTEVYVNYMLLDDLPPPFNLLPTVRLITNRSAKSVGYAGLDDEPFNLVEFRALMAELVKRYYMHKHQLD